MDVSLKTDRLLLRQPLPTDAERITVFLDNIAVTGNLSRVPYPYRLSDARAWLRTWRPDRPASETGFTIDLPGEGLVGHVGFSPDETGTVLGYWLAEPFWGRGFMTEAVRAALEWYFSASEAPSVGSGAFHFNAPSLAIQRRMGFREVGTSMRLCLARGEDVRHIDTELSRATWAKKRAA